MMQGEAELYEELREQLLVQTAFVALDPKIGSILAMVGGRPDYHDQYNRSSSNHCQDASYFGVKRYKSRLHQQLFSQFLVQFRFALHHQSHRVFRIQTQRCLIGV
jgi:membrane carboxypeptidase/penicillin-binding protein